MRTVVLPDGKHVPVLGRGKARAQLPEKSQRCVWESKEIVTEAILGQHKGIFVVTKVYPHNASRKELPKTCERSLKRLRIDAIDLYLLHWRERTLPLQETVDTFEQSCALPEK